MGGQILGVLSTDVRYLAVGAAGAPGSACSRSLASMNLLTSLTGPGLPLKKKNKPLKRKTNPLKRKRTTP